MRFLSTDECLTWSEEHGYKIPEHKTSEHAAGFSYLDFSALNLEGTEFQLPEDSGSKVGLARIVMENLVTAPEVLLWVRDWDVWPSSGHLPLFDRFREAHGERRALSASPGHLASCREADEIISILVVSMEFFWDCLALTSTGGAAFFTSHDEFFRFFAESGILCQFKSKLEAGRW